MASSETIFDSSVWIAYFSPSETRHSEARKLLEQAAVIIIPEYVLLEVVTVLRQKKEEELLAGFMSLATDAKTYLPADTLGSEVAAEYTKPRYKKLSFVDVSLVLLAKQYNVVTFDKALLTAIKQP